MGSGTDVLPGQGADQLGQDVLSDHSSGHVLALVRQVAQSPGCCLLDAGDHVQHQGVEQGHDT